MLETQLKELTQEVKGLREQLQLFVDASVNKYRETQTADTKTPDQPAQPSSDADNGTTVDDVKRLCQAVVRQDRTLKDTVKQVISDTGDGAKVLGDVPKDKLPAVEAEVRALLKSET